MRTSSRGSLPSGRIWIRNPLGLCRLDDIAGETRIAKKECDTGKLLIVPAAMVILGRRLVAAVVAFLQPVQIALEPRAQTLAVRPRQTWRLG